MLFRVGRYIVVLFLLVRIAGADARECALAGRVLDPDGRAVADAIVVVSGPSPASSQTNQIGRYSFCSLTAGEYTMTISAAGFTPAVEAVTVSEATQAERTSTLHVAPVHLAVTVEATEPALRDTLDIGDVRESAAKDLGEALSRIEGVWKVRRGAIGNDVVVRGFQRDNINVVVDGARVHGACPNRMDPVAYHVDFTEVQQVDVVKGAFDVTGQGSMGAMVNVVTKSPPPGVQVRPSFTAASFNSYNAAVTASYSGDRLHALAGYSWRSGAPYEDGSGKAFTTYTNYNASAVQRRAYDIHTGWFKLGTRMGPHDVSLGYTRQQGGAVLYPYLLMDALYDNADRVTLKYTRERRGTVSRVAGEAYVTQVRHFMTDDFRSSALESGFSMATNAASRVTGGNLRAEAGSFSFGADGLLRRWNALNYMRIMGAISVQNIIPDVQTAGGGAFLSFRRQLAERVSLAGGARFDALNTAAAETAATSLYQAYHATAALSRSDVYPSGNLRLSIRVLRDSNLLLGFGSTARVPDAQERFFAQKKMGQDVVGNPNLPPVRNSEFTVGLNFRHGASYLRSSHYYSVLSDYMTPNRQPRQQMAPGVMNSMARSYENVAARMYGGEVSYGWAAAEPVLLSGGVAWTRGIKDVKPQALIFDPDLVEMPPVRAWTSLRYTHHHWFAEAELVAAGRQQRVDMDLREVPTAGYSLINLKTGMQLKRLQVMFSMENALNRCYYEHFSYNRDPFRSGVRIPEPGRNVWSMISYRF